jgi:hypothetical protein
MYILLKCIRVKCSNAGTVVSTGCWTLEPGNQTQVSRSVNCNRPSKYSLIYLLFKMEGNFPVHY